MTVGVEVTTDLSLGDVLSLLEEVGGAEEEWKMATSPPQKVGMPTTSGVPRRSPIQVLTGPNVA